MESYERPLNAAMKAATTSSRLQEKGKEEFYDKLAFDGDDLDGALEAALDAVSKDREAYMKGYQAFWQVKNKQDGSLVGRAGNLFTSLKSKVGLHGPTVLH